MSRKLIGLYLLSLMTLAPSLALALGTAEEGNKPLKDRRMPAGADAIINRKDRVAWSEGEGPFQAEGRGGIKAVNQILADFAKVDVKIKRVVVHDGAGQSSVITVDENPQRKKNPRIDWTFSVWPKGKWEHARRHYLRMNLTPPEEAELATQIDIFTAKVRWADVIVPAGIEVIDQRLEAHGFTDADGIVFEGQVNDLSGKKPMVAVVRVESMEIKNENWVYTTVAETRSNAQGKWVLKNLSPEGARIVVEAEGFVPRVDYVSIQDTPHWRSFQADLARGVTLSGRVTDQQGKPLADVKLRMSDLVVEPNLTSQTSSELITKTDSNGLFHFDQVPEGRASIRGYQSGRPSLLQVITIPLKNVELTSLNPGSLRVSVDFTGKDRPAEYVVELEHDGENAVGKFSATIGIDAKNAAIFENVPPGRYSVKGHPNPSTEEQATEVLKVDFSTHSFGDVTIKAK